MGQGGSSRELGRVGQAWAGWQPGSQAWQQHKGGDVWPHTPHPTTRPPPPSVKEVRMFMSLKRSTCGLHAVRGSVRAGVRILGGLKPVGGQFLCSALFWEGPHCGENGISPNWPIETWAHSYTRWRRTVRRALLGFEVHSTGFSRERCLGACCWPISSRLSAPGNAVYPQDAAPLAPPCRRVKDARYRPAHG